MTTDYRALCVELLDALESIHQTWRIPVSPLVARARAALPLPAGGGGVMTWQPINTAPKDGTEILISDYDAMDIVSWIEPRFNWTSGEWINREGEAMYPAWWQPLPDHPPLPEEEV